MIAFIPLSIPVSWVIDTYGFKLAVSIGAVLMGIFGLLRGFAGANYSLVLWSTIGIAAAQPFLLQRVDESPANWFAIEERHRGWIGHAFRSGRTALGMVLTPILTETISIPTVQLIYGGIAAFSAILFVLFERLTFPTARAATSPGAHAGWAQTCAYRKILPALLSCLVHRAWHFQRRHYLGRNYHSPARIHPTDAGHLVLHACRWNPGAVIIPPFSDKQRKRQPYILLGLILAIPGLWVWHLRPVHGCCLRLRFSWDFSL